MSTGKAIKTVGPAVLRRQTAASTSNRIRASVWLCWLFILFAVGRVHEFVPGLGAIPLVKGIVGLWVIACVVEARKFPRPSLLHSPITRGAFYLFGLAALSIVFSIWQGGTFTFLMDTALIIVVAILLVHRTLWTWADVRGMLSCLVVVAAVLAVAGFLAYAGGRLEVDSSYDTNDLAYLLVTALPLCIGFFRISKGIWRVGYFGLTGFLVMAVLLTQSRGALLALAAIAMAYFLLPMPSVDTDAAAARDRNGKGNGKGNIKGSRVTVLLLAVGVFAVGWNLLPDDARQRLGGLSDVSSDYNVDRENVGGRINIWTRLTVFALERPIGAGAGTSPMVDVRTGGQFRAPHNSVIQILVELGFIGLIIYLRIHWLAVKNLRRLAGEESAGEAGMPVLAHALVVSLVANFVAGFFLSQGYSALLWVLMTIIAVMTTLNVTPGRQMPRFR